MSDSMRRGADGYAALNGSRLGAGRVGTMKHGHVVCGGAPCRTFQWREWTVRVIGFHHVFRVEAQSATHWFSQDYADYSTPAFVATMAMRGMRKVAASSVPISEH